MLAQSFQSAAELGITEPQLSALQKTLVLLETEKLSHWDRSRLDAAFVPVEQRKFSNDFNMASWSLAHTCGTVCCIGGTAEMIGGLQPYSLDDAANTNPDLHGLFYPRTGIKNYATITPEQAARALRSYLTTGDAKWAEAVA